MKECKTVKAQAINDMVLIQLEEKIEKTASGIYLAKSDQEEPNIGWVKSVGNEVKFCKEGHKVMFAKMAGQKIKLENQEYLIIREGQIFLIIE